MALPTVAAARPTPLEKAGGRVDLLLARLPLGMACAAWVLALALHRALPWLAGLAASLALPAALWLSVRALAKRPAAAHPHRRYALLFLFPFAAKPADFAAAGTRAPRARMKGAWLLPLIPSYVFGVSYSIFVKGYLWHTRLYSIEANPLWALKRIDLFAAVCQHAASCFMLVGCYMEFAALYAHHLAAARLSRRIGCDPVVLPPEYYVTKVSGYATYFGLLCLLQLGAVTYLTAFPPRRLQFLELWAADWVAGHLADPRVAAPALASCLALAGAWFAWARRRPAERVWVYGSRRATTAAALVSFVWASLVFVLLCLLWQSVAPVPL